MSENAQTKWALLVESFRRKPTPFATQRSLFQSTFAEWNSDKDGPPPAWTPSPSEAARTHVGQFMKEMGFSSYRALHDWTLANRAAFWGESLKRLGIPFVEAPKEVLGKGSTPENPAWLSGARLNIAEACFQASASETAIVFRREGAKGLEKTTYGELAALSNRVANGLIKRGFRSGDRIAIDMGMTTEAVAIYLGILKMGGAAVSIADSFAADEVKTRLEIAGAKAAFTQDFNYRGGKKLPLYSKVVEAEAETIIVLPGGEKLEASLRPNDVAWSDFLSEDTSFRSVSANPYDVTNVLFSSGTTGEPKAIPWTHLTPIKSAADGYWHQDIRPRDVVAWPTNLGWMMGPWLIYAALVNRATIALYYGAPTGKDFGEFIQDAKVTMLGLVPSLVKAWRNSACMEGLDWSQLRCFSSTGECSNADDYLYLMSLAGYRPVVEYCGGTEIGGGFLTQTLAQPASPATFSTTALGIDVEILGAEARPSRIGELFIKPPSIGLSQSLLNRDHHQTYFEDVPAGPEGEVLRRHGDEFERLGGGYFRAHGRADDTMNLGGIKVSSVEIERLLNLVEGVSETAAIAANPLGGGPSLLVIYTVAKPGAKVEPAALKSAFQKTLREKLNPLFKVDEVILASQLPRTASNKVMRRVLRSEYEANRP